MRHADSHVVNASVSGETTDEAGLPRARARGVQRPGVQGFSNSRRQRDGLRGLPSGMRLGARSGRRSTPPRRGGSRAASGDAHSTCSYGRDLPREGFMRSMANWRTAVPSATLCLFPSRQVLPSIPTRFSKTALHPNATSAQPPASLEAIVEPARPGDRCSMMRS